MASVLKFLFAAAIIVPTATACDGASPGTPSAAAPPLADGLYMLQVMGDSTLCNDIKNPNVGTSLTASLTATHDASGMWIARGTTAADGTIELRLGRSNEVTTAPSGPLAGSGIAVAGSISGVANDTGFGSSSPPSTKTATFAHQPVTGVFRALPKFADGYSGGIVTFAKDGVSSACPSGAASWVVSGPM